MMIISALDTFLDVFFTRTVLSLVEIGNPFERRSAGGSGRNYPEHYHLYEILCASLCIVIIPSLFIAGPSAGGASRRQQEQPDTRALRKVTILIKACWLLQFHSALIRAKFNYGTSYGTT